MRFASMRMEAPIPTPVTDPGQCGGPVNPGGSANPDFNSLLLPADLTRGGSLFPFNGHTDIKLLSMYLQDAITTGPWTFNLGLRGDFYNGFVSHNEAEPRLGIAYNVKRTNTVFRASYARVLETPFNENLILSSTGCANPVLNPLLVCASQCGHSVQLPDGVMSSTLVCSRHSGSIWSSPVSTCGNTRITLTISGFSGPLR